MANTILIIDDEPKLRQLLARIIGLEGFEVIQAADIKEARKKLERHSIDVVLSDVKLPDGNGVELVTEIKKQLPGVEIIMLTANGNIPDGVQAIKNGAFDYLVKGDDNDRIIPLLHRAIEKAEMQKRIQQLEKQVGKKYTWQNIIGKSKAIVQAVELAQKVANTDTTVLLTGETGTGKEVFAQAIHQHSARSAKNFVAVNCSAISRELLESELFGHMAGAFTGAVKETRGYFEEAANGTIFLDEIGEMDLNLQAKLLRVLETGEFFKVGSTKPVKVNVRVVAATNRNLQRESEAGTFRLDLYYRLNVFEIRLPALNERVKDIAELANYFIKQASDKNNKRAPVIGDSFLQALQTHNWKGNIRELKNVIERAVLLCASNTLQLSDLPFDFQKEPAASGNASSAFDLASAEKLHIQRVLNYTGGNKAEAARLLNIGVATLYRKIEEYHLQ